MTMAGIGIWTRRAWSRWLVVLLYVFPIPIEIIYSRRHSRPNGLPLGYGIEAVVWAGFFYWYLFYSRRSHSIERSRGFTRSWLRHLADPRSAEKAGTSKDFDGFISDSQPNVCHVLRNTLVDLNDAGISVNYFLLFGLPLFIRTAN
jgi:hypothetical protein